MSFAPNLFLSNVKAKSGLARPNRYEIILPIPAYVNSFIGQSLLEQIVNFPNSIYADVTNAVTSLLGSTDENTKTSNPSISRYLALQCESAELPGKTLNTADVKIYGPGFKVPYQTQYAETTLSFLCTNEFYERKLFERWIECIMPSDTNNLRFAKGSSTRYLTNIQIVQYDDFIKKIFAVELIDAYPIGIAPQSLSWSDDGFHRLSVQFAYQRYKPVYDGSYNLGQAAGALFGSAGTRLFERVGQDISSSIGSVLNKIF
jgi:hypothetical protein